ncbi:MAG: EboA domain-containing protein [Planctomycetota bacterium]
MSNAIASTLRETLRTRLEPEAAGWLDAAVASVTASADALAQAFTEAARRCGRGQLLEAGERASLAIGPFSEVSLGGWRRGDAARAVLLLADAARDAAHPLAWAAARYFSGDAQERISLVRAFGLLPGAGVDAAPSDEPGMNTAADTPRVAALRAVLDACRQNHAQLFDAATAGNPFFSAAAPELEFNKAVLKRVFLDLPADVVLGLAARANKELSRMLLNLVEEREVTLRPWPIECLPIIARCPSAGFVARLIGGIEHADDQIRLSAAKALLVLPDGAGKAAAAYAADRATRERRPEVVEVLEQVAKLR